MLHITPAEIRVPYTIDLTENAYILLFPRSSLHNLISFNVLYFYCMSSSISLKLHLVTMLWFKWWHCKILCTEVIVLLPCKFLNCPPFQSYPQPLTATLRHSWTATQRHAHTHILHTYHCHTDHELHNKWLEPVNSLTPVTDHSFITVHRMFTCHQLGI